MAESPVVIPNPRIPSALGTLNIVFGSLMLLSSLATVTWTLVYPHLLKMSARPMPSEQERAKRIAEIDGRLAELNKKLDTEKDAGGRGRLQEEIGTLEEERDSNELDLTDFNTQDMRDLRVSVPFWADHLLGILLNVLMIVSGAGLIALRNWGRKLALRVAALKIVKLVVMTIVAVGLTIPLQAVRTRQLWARMEARSGPGAMGGASMATTMTQMSAIYSTVLAVGFGGAGLIYPAISLWLLNKRTARAAFARVKFDPAAGPPGSRPSDLS